MTNQVNRPAHYTDGKIEVIDFIEDKKLNFNLGNAVKYISRAGKKNPDKHIEDLEKALWYLNREIEGLKKLSFELPLYIAKDQRDDSIRFVRWKEEDNTYIPFSQVGEFIQEDIKKRFFHNYKLSGNDNSESLDYYKLF